MTPVPFDDSLPQSSNQPHNANRDRPNKGSYFRNGHNDVYHLAHLPLSFGCTGRIRTCIVFAQNEAADQLADRAILVDPLGIEPSSHALQAYAMTSLAQGQKPSSPPVTFNSVRAQSRII